MDAADCQPDFCLDFDPTGGNSKSKYYSHFLLLHLIYESFLQDMAENDVKLKIATQQNTQSSKRIWNIQ